MQSENSGYSIYNPYAFDRQSNPLLDVIPIGPEKGHRASRSLKKVLNHLDFIKSKERIVNELKVQSSRYFASEGYDILRKYINNAYSLNETIFRLSANSSLSPSIVRDKLREYATVTHIEFHPTDACNLSCIGCTYGHNSKNTKPPPISFPFEAIDKIAFLNPKSILIIGGGEPTLYYNKKHGFLDLFDKIQNTFPESEIALVTNGTRFIEGEWLKRISWLRISLDAAGDEKYRELRGGNFKNVLSNILQYIRSEVKEIEIGFLFSKYNISEYVKISEFIYGVLCSENSDLINKVNIAYRPLRLNPLDNSDHFFVNNKEIDSVIEQVNALCQTSAEMKSFLINHTNIAAILGGNTHPPQQFEKCYYSEIFRIVRANGDLYPCFVRVRDKEFCLGNLIHNEIEEIALMEIWISGAMKRYCDPEGCRQCHLNHIIEEGLSGRMNKSDDEEVLKKKMF